MRILQITPPRPPAPSASIGRVESIVSSLTDGLTALGHDAMLVTLGERAARTELIGPFGASTPRGNADIWTDAADTVRAYARTEDIDVIHDHTGVVGPSLAAVAELNVPIVTTLHGPWTLENSALFSTVSRHLALTVVSHDQAERAPEGIRVAAVVHDGITLDAYPVGRTRSDFLLFVGHASPEFGPEVALELARRARMSLVMVLQVDGQEEQDHLEHVVRPAMAGLHVDLRHTITHREKVDLMGRTRAVVVPNAWGEPFGLIMAEAAACGAPVIAYRRGSAPELVLDGITGRLVAPGDMDTMTDAVDEVASFDPLDCRAWAQGRFSARRMVNRYLRVYEELGSRAGTNEVTRPDTHEAEREAARDASRAMHPSSGARSLHLVPDTAA